MAAVRKSAVSASGIWFWQNSRPTVERRRSARRGSAQHNKSSELHPVVSPQRQRRSAKISSVSANNGLQKVGQPKVSPSKNQPKTVQPNSQSDSLKLPVVPTAEAFPTWLLRLYTIHRYSSIVTFLLVAIALVIYGWTVYSQEMWSQDFRRLQNLQRNERQLTTTNAMLKNKMAEEAEKATTGLVSPTPDRTIFLPSASNTPNPTPTETKPKSPKLQPTSLPLGY
ncbi:hypothetical protein H6G76_12465 [Nostoc sp. FACHB-152]|uniref:hypothetical protein n=1 Tax=unclassified Nostoc TaxID=2593658 RepID=UPI001683FF7D|nr:MULTISPECIES: hypothetical protein [unclassified Nostoc]MBD2447978.1 hypothetical protein [Nostoc sp. FACHB-152]MBD2466085.1 hypothetical protein [Nostoc sp. FACHB-145]